ncbi:MAG: DUF370 domain-containing protein [Paenibacillus sp. RIFOXYA1_FULL_44_5]|nr:MAG: DUF370 domain-containing protein [Paenibacillus sp. RIFOXYA1_FULL_44_5]
MYIHLGGDKVIQATEIVSIFDISIEKSSKISKSFIQHATRENCSEIIGDEECKSLVVTKNKLYYSPISSSTLKKRANLLTAN